MTKCSKIAKQQPKTDLEVLRRCSSRLETKRAIEKAPRAPKKEKIPAKPFVFKNPGVQVVLLSLFEQCDPKADEVLSLASESTNVNSPRPGE